ncbi:hypothetical protein [Candidatus Galacturonibacter soehngenii]|uniref:Uncharacterized protein n=1 Tax=Candidatus Galacturonatibacter soehngenii TaxID=2307010 RepID=A0A7V7UBE7_9FIRM|nr:hypothetical protein [Candidatus Galacturonibacter soehngenii]KAB1438033.1 hypothetical protein F7O84_10685 [Candidatus Galacturonibacter soehngenii]
MYRKKGRKRFERIFWNGRILFKGRRASVHTRYRACFKTGCHGGKRCGCLSATFSHIGHEGLICYEKQEGEWKPEYIVTAILDKECGELLYDEEEDFVACVFHWQEGKISLEELEKEPCEIEGILTFNQKRDSGFKEERQNGKNSYCR